MIDDSIEKNSKQLLIKLSKEILAFFEFKEISPSDTSFIVFDSLINIIRFYLKTDLELNVKKEARKELIDSIRSYVNLMLDEVGKETINEH